MVLIYFFARSVQVVTFLMIAIRSEKRMLLAKDILSLVNDFEIGSLVVECITVNMVNLFV